MRVHALADTLLSDIKRDKAVFVTNLRQLIENDVATRTPAECLAVTTTLVNGGDTGTSEHVSVTWTVKDGAAYVPRLWAFIRQREFVEQSRSYTVDSALTPRIVEIVLAAYDELVKKHQDKLVEVVTLSEMIKNPSLSTHEGFLQTILTDELLGKVRGKAVSLVIDQLAPAAQEGGQQLATHVAVGAAAVVVKVSATAFAKAAASVIAKAAATATGKAVFAKITVQAVQLISLSVTKLLAKPALVLGLQKLVGSAFVVTFMKVAAAKLGVAVSVLTMMLIPLIIGWVIYDVYRFPKTLGANIADALCENIDETFDPVMNEMVNGMVEELTKAAPIDGLIDLLTKELDASVDPKRIGTAVQAQAWYKKVWLLRRLFAE